VYLQFKKFFLGMILKKTTVNDVTWT